MGRLVQAERPLRQHASTVGSECALRKLRELASELLPGLESAPGFDKPVDEADLQCFHRRDRAAGEDEVERPALADHARQPDRAHVDQRNAEAPVEHTERCVAGRDA
jgi:hypothetical protein